MTLAAQFREATPADAVVVAALYRPFVEATTANFEETAPDAAEMARRMAAVAAAGLPWLIAEAGGAVVGYAYAAPYRPRPAYRFAVEDSIYLAPAAQGAGLGRRLLAALIARSAAAGARRMIAVIGDPPTQARSIALHRALGFEEAGRLVGVGWKAGGWRDTLLMQRALGEGVETPPSDLRPISR